MRCTFEPLRALCPIESREAHPFDPLNCLNNIINLGLQGGGVSESEFLEGELHVQSRAIRL